jgi:rod shape-determining protein MreD
MMSVILGLIAAVFGLLQTTWLSSWTVGGARPDLVLLVIAYAAHLQGVQKGQVTGFAVGAFEDVLSLSPLGFHAVIRLAVGALMGRTHGSVRGDAVIMPALLGIVATVVKVTATLIVSFLLGMDEVREGVLALRMLIELGLNAVFAPLVFLALGPISRRFMRRGGFS